MDIRNFFGPPKVSNKDSKKNSKKRLSLSKNVSPKKLNALSKEAVLTNNNDKKSDPLLVNSKHMTASAVSPLPLTNDESVTCSKYFPSSIEKKTNEDNPLEETVIRLNDDDDGLKQKGDSEKKSKMLKMKAKKKEMTKKYVDL